MSPLNSAECAISETEAHSPYYRHDLRDSNCDQNRGRDRGTDGGRSMRDGPSPHSPSRHAVSTCGSTSDIRYSGQCQKCFGGSISAPDSANYLCTLHSHRVIAKTIDVDGNKNKCTRSLASG